VRATGHESPLYAVYPLPCYFFVFASNIFLNTIFSNTPSLHPSLSVTDQVSHSYETTGKIIILYISIFILFDNKERCVFSHDYIRQHMEPACSYKAMVPGITSQSVSMSNRLHGVTSQNVSMSTRLHDFTSQKGASLYLTA
jgi:hypothetical protein